ncbi:MAG: bifunctional diaminohydroxyphosphoribosylaminopyrimidine deaminase/5-amino-6-(5-phosphoribosylamino)uracil reductase RibD [Planctomycetes bacterium]|nr:bifunctional diaminohydroxyphosphoribosylaminopyrimidine deaminase/5-amino-6-(5-phosphoribosylamino)uracil reductase RibD [Planctomycetota bacterium]
MNYELLMRQALELAMMGKGTTHPNPIVGALVVDDTGEIHAKGFHKKAGGNHAEVNAILDLQQKGISARDKTIIVTLEPCNHHGNTPPCTEAIMDAGFKRVAIGATDTNPKVKGKGAQRLRDAGVEVVENVLARDCRKQNRAYFSRIERNRPWIIAKWAMSVDGKIATKTGDSFWITCDESRKLAQELRANAGAVLVGTGTILKDDPMLNYRGDKELLQPVRVILDPSGKTSGNLKIYQSEEGGPVLRIRTQHENSFIDSEKYYKIVPARFENCTINSVQDIFVSDMLCRGKKLLLPEILTILSTEFDISAILVEGGMTTITEFFDAGLIDEVNVFISPKIIGGKDAFMPIAGEGVSNMRDITEIKEFEHRIIDNQDIFMQGFINTGFFAPQ